MGNRNKSNDKKVIDSRNVHNPGYLFLTCPNVIIHKESHSCDKM